MTNLKLTLLAAAAIGAASIGGASALPMSGTSPALAESDVQQVRVVCNQRGVCWDTRSPRRTWRSSRNSPRYAQPYYGQPQYGYQQPGVGIGVGPFGIWVR